MIKKICKLLSLALCLCLLVSCAPLELNPEELYAPPTLSEDHRAIFKAVERVVGSEYVLKYPSAGDHRSAVILNDLDNDGTAEALVFYGNSENDAVRIIALCAEGNGWSVACDVTGSGSNIDRLEFLTVDNTTYLLVGFHQNSASDKTMLIYNYQNGMLNPLYIRDYSEMALCDIDQNGRQEVLVFINNYTAHFAFARVLNFSGSRVSESGECYMNEDVVQYDRVTVGTLASGAPAVYVDSRLASGSLMTEVITYTDGVLQNLMYGSDNTLLEQTVRDSHLLSQDINNDGFIEIPVRSDMDAYEDSLVTRWQQIDGGTLREVCRSLDNENAGYRLVCPARWEDQVFVREVVENNEWIVVSHGYNTGDVPYELLSIRVYADDDTIDQFVLEDYTLFTEKGRFGYYVSIASLENNALAITQDELKDCFQFINRKV